MANLSVDVAGLELRNPLMPAAGPIVRDGYSLVEVANNGAGALVSKTVSTEPAKVPRPNMAKIGTNLINSDLWSELPLDQWIKEEFPRAKGTGLPLIASIGYSPEEVEELTLRLNNTDVDAFEISTPSVVRDTSSIEETVKAAKDNTDLPVLVKLSPQIPDITEAAVESEAAGADGVVAINEVGPALKIDINTENPVMGSENGYGWLSGPSINPIAVRCVADIARAVDMPVIGAGGVKEEADVVEFLMAGASAVQICTAAITRGIKIFGLIADKLGRFMNARGYDSIEDLRGVALKNLPDEPLRTTSKQPELFKSRCTGCGLCVKHCPYDAVTIVGGNARMDSAKCVGCGLCVSVCPSGALRF